MEVFDQNSHLALIVPIVYTYKSPSAHQCDVYWQQNHRSWDCWSTVRGGKKIAILSSPPFLVHNWSGACQSPGTCSWSSSEARGNPGRQNLVSVPRLGVEHIGREREQSCQGWVQNATGERNWAMRIKPFNPQPLTLVFLWFHQIHGNLPWAESPLPSRATWH